MHFTTLSLVSLLSATAFALPQTTVTPGQTSPWNVTDYTTTCASGGCTYSFVITGPDTPGFGGSFSTDCSGTDVQSKTTNCTNTEFSSTLQEVHGGRILTVQRTFLYGSETEVASGYSTRPNPSIAAPPATFIIDAQVYGQIAE